MGDVAGDPQGDADLVARILGLVRDVPDFPTPGIAFKDITPLLGDGPVLGAVVDAMVARLRAAEPAVDVVVGIEARGFILAAPVAVGLGVGFVPFRKPGKLPRACLEVPYSLEYGADRLAGHVDAIGAGRRVVVVDDVLATGGTATAACALVEALGGVVAGVAVLIELAELEGRSALSGVEVSALVTI